MRERKPKATPPQTKATPSPVPRTLRQRLRHQGLWLAFFVAVLVLVFVLRWSGNGTESTRVSMMLLPQWESLGYLDGRLYYVEGKRLFSIDAKANKFFDRALEAEETVLYGAQELYLVRPQVGIARLDKKTGETTTEAPLPDLLRAEWQDGRVVAYTQGGVVIYDGALQVVQAHRADAPGGLFARSEEGLEALVLRGPTDRLVVYRGAQELYALPVGKDRVQQLVWVEDQLGVLTPEALFFFSERGLERQISLGKGTALQAGQDRIGVLDGEQLRLFRPSGEEVGRFALDYAVKALVLHDTKGFVIGETQLGRLTDEGRLEVRNIPEVRAIQAHGDALVLFYSEGIESIPWKSGETKRR